MPSNQTFGARRWRVVWVCSLCFFLMDLILTLGGYLVSSDQSLRRSLHSPLPEPLAGIRGFVQAISLVDVTARGHDLAPLLMTLAVIALATLFLGHGRIWTALLLFAAVGGAGACATVLQNAIAVPPPRIYRLHGFPSRHAAVFFALYAVVACVAYHSPVRRLLRLGAVIMAGLLILLVGISVQGYHYPSEVLAGYALAGCWLALLLSWLGDRVAREARG